MEKGVEGAHWGWAVRCRVEDGLPQALALDGETSDFTKTIKI
jgi:hypothetical protein